MRRLLFAALVALVPFAAAADPTPVQIVATAFTGMGQIGSVTGTSTSVATVTPAPNSIAWSMPLKTGVVRIKNLPSSTGTLAVCPMGGVCSCANSPDVLSVGETGADYNIGSATTTPPTVIACNGATVAVGVMWK